MKYIRSFKAIFVQFDTFARENICEIFPGVFSRSLAGRPFIIVYTWRAHNKTTLRRKKFAFEFIKTFILPVMG